MATRIRSSDEAAWDSCLATTRRHKTERPLLLRGVMMKTVLHVDDAGRRLHWARLRLFVAEFGNCLHNVMVKVVVGGVWIGLEMLMC